MGPFSPGRRAVVRHRFSGKHGSLRRCVTVILLVRFRIQYSVSEKREQFPINVESIVVNE